MSVSLSIISHDGTPTRKTTQPRLLCYSSLSNCHEQPIPDIAQARLDHAFLCYRFVNSCNPYLNTLLPFASCPHDTLSCSKHTDQYHSCDAPLPKCLNGGGGRAPGGDDGVKQDCEFRRRRVRRWCGASRRSMIWKIVVVLDWRKGRGLAEEPKMVYRDRIGKEDLQSYQMMVSLSLYQRARARLWRSFDSKASEQHLVYSRPRAETAVHTFEHS